MTLAQYYWILYAILCNKEIAQKNAAQNCWLDLVSVSILSGVRRSPLVTAAATGLLYQPQMRDDGGCGATGRMKIWQGKPKGSEKTCPSVTFSTTNATWPDSGSNPGHRGGKSGTNGLNYGVLLSLSMYSGTFPLADEGHSTLSPVWCSIFT
jgi:hypothetical protein